MGRPFVIEKAEPSNPGVAVLVSNPVTVAGMVKVRECKNFEQLAKAIDEVYAKLCDCPRNPNASIADPMPGFQVSYLPASDDLPILDPNQPWQTFVDVLDLIIAVPK